MPQEIGKIEDTAWGPMRVIRQKDFDAAREMGITQFSYCCFNEVTFEEKGERWDFTGSRFSDNCSIKSSQFTHCDFTNTSIDCNVENSNFTSSNFTRAAITGTFYDSDLSNSFFKESSFRHMTFFRCKLNRCEMYQATLDSAYFADCEAFGMAHIDTITFALSGASDDGLKSYQAEMIQKLTPEIFEEPISQLRAMKLGSRLHIYDMEWDGPPLSQRDIPKGLTLEAATQHWLNSSDGLPYRMRTLHNYETLLGIAEKDCLTERDYLTAHWQPRAGVELEHAEQKLNEYKKQWKTQQNSVEQRPAKRSSIDIAKEQITTLCANFRRDPAEYIQYLQFTARFYQYSGRNKMLIYQQNEDANFVGSRTYFKQQGYELKPGEWKKPLWIIRPESKELFMREGGLVVSVKDASPAEKKRIEAGEIRTEKVTFFRAAKVYEIGQTTCPPSDYPKILGHGISEAKHAQLYERLKNLVQLSGIPVTEKPLPASLFGYCEKDGRSIAISDSLGDTQKLATLNHEYAHALLHSICDLPAAIEEFEAESAALIMQQRLGLPVEDLTISYVKDSLSEAQALPDFNFEQSIGRIVKQADFVGAQLSLQELIKSPEIQYAPVQDTAPNFSPAV